MKKLLSFTLLLSLPALAATCPKPNMNAKGAFEIISKKQTNLCEYLENYLVSKTARNESCETMFHAAIKNSNASAVNCLESINYTPQNAAQINKADQFLTANYYEFAVMHAPLDIIKNFHQNGGQLSNLYMNGYSEFTLAAAYNNLDVVRYFDRRGTNVNDMRNPNKANGLIQSAMHRAASTNTADVVSYIVRRGGDVNLQYKAGLESEYVNTPLSFAASNNKKEIVELLIRAGGEVDGNGSTYSPLELAISNKKVEIAKLLINSGTDVTKGYNPPIIAAAKINNLEALELLIRSGADIYARDRSGSNSMGYAVGGGNQELVDFLLRAGSPLTSGNTKGLLEIVVEKNQEIKFYNHLKYLGAPEPNMNWILSNSYDCSTGERAYYRRSSCSDKPAFENAKKFVAYALKNGANSNVKFSGYTGGDNTTLLMRSVQIGNLELVKLMVENGGNIHDQDGKGLGMLHYSIFRNSKLSETTRVSMIRYLVSLGADKKEKMNSYSSVFFFDDNTGYISDSLTAFEVAKKLGMDISIQNALK